MSIDNLNQGVHLMTFLRLLVYYEDDSYPFLKCDSSLCIAHIWKYRDKTKLSNKFHAKKFGKFLWRMSQISLGPKLYLQHV